MKKVTCLCFVTLAILISACKKTDKVIRINSELKRDFGFGIGTYWIYRDSITGSMDTFFVRESFNVVQHARDMPQIEVQTANIQCNTDWTYACFFKMMENSFGFTFTHYKISCSFEYDKYDQLLPIDHYVSGSLSIDSIKEIKNVSCLYYVKKGIGFIKIKIKNDTFSKTWELQDYKIIQ